MENTLKIAGILINLQLDKSGGKRRKMKCFQTGSMGEDIKITYRQNEEIPVPDNLIAFDESIQWVPDNLDGNRELYIFNRVTRKPAYKLLADKSWNRIEVVYRSDEKKPLNSFLSSVGEIVFRNRLLHYTGMVIHGAAIECEGKGIIFSGPSGIGKTTQANLWRRYKKAVMINHDRPAIRMIDQKTYVYGTLWNGSYNGCTSRIAPLRAIVLLEQHSTDSIERLEGKEALNRLMPRCFLPYNCNSDMELALSNLERILAVTPVYYLKCRPDRGAVELLYQCLK